MPADPLCRSMEVIVEGFRRNKLTSEQFMSDDAPVEEPEPHDRSIPVIIKKEAEPVKLKTEAEPVTVKTEPDTEGSGITVPAEPIRV